MKPFKIHKQFMMWWLVLGMVGAVFGVVFGDKAFAAVSLGVIVANCVSLALYTQVASYAKECYKQYDEKLERVHSLHRRCDEYRDMLESMEQRSAKQRKEIGKLIRLNKGYKEMSDMGWKKVENIGYGETELMLTKVDSLYQLAYQELGVWYAEDNTQLLKQPTHYRLLEQKENKL